MKTQYQQYFYNPKGHEIPLIFCTLENVETVNELYQANNSPAQKSIAT